MHETGKGLLAAREDLGIAGLDLALRLRRRSCRCAAARAQLAVRWNTVRWPTSPAMVWMVWMPVAPVPITATRLPVKSTFSFGQRAVWNDWPLKSSRPSMRGRVGVDSGPIAVIRKRAAVLRSRSPA